MFGLNVLGGPVLGLIVNERPHTLPDFNKSLDAVRRCDGHLYRVPDHPEMVMGEMREVSGPHGPETACLTREGQNLGEQLAAAL